VGVGYPDPHNHESVIATSEAFITVLDPARFRKEQNAQWPKTTTIRNAPPRMS
jgi:hypothetical protein